MKNTWGEEVEEHEPKDCRECKGTEFIKLPYGALADEIEDEDNCYCDCHSAPLREGAGGMSR